MKKTITEKQYNSLCAKMGNGFSFDKDYYIRSGHKCAFQTFPTVDGGYWDVSIGFIREEYRDSDGYLHISNKYTPAILVTHYTPISRPDFPYPYYADTVCRREGIGEEVDRRTFSIIQKLTHKVNALAAISKLFDDDHVVGHNIVENVNAI